MKYIFLLIVLTSFSSFSYGQILKQLKRELKYDAKTKARQKADIMMDNALDSLVTHAKKSNNKKRPKKKENASGQIMSSETKQNNHKEQSTGIAKATETGSENESSLTPKDGYIALNLSVNKIFAGGYVTFSGKSVKYKQLSKVEIKISGPSTNIKQQVNLDKDGKFSVNWRTPVIAGDYIITAKSSDEKSTQSAVLKVYSLPALSSWADKNIELTNRAFDKLEKEVERAKASIGPKDRAELTAKLEEVKVKKDAAITLFTDLNEAGKKFAGLVKPGKSFPPNLAGNLSALNNLLADQAVQMEQDEEYGNHEAFDNTVCEYLVMVKEACAAFSTFTTFYGAPLKKLIINIMVDKALPKTVEVANNDMVVPSDYDVSLKEPAKILAKANFDAESFNSNMSPIGLAGGLVQFASEFLLKKYCGIFEGRMTHDYTIDFRNSSGNTWWKYGVKMKAGFSLRYPKNQNSKIIKMKGNFEGNATDFSFFADIAIEDEFRMASKDKLEVIPIYVYTPVTIGYSATSLDILGFGAVARGLATPAYFNIPVDAEYDVDANKIKIFINKAIIDFQETIANQYIFLLVGGDLFPYIKAINFPINKARLTLKAVFAGNNIFPVKKDAKGNLSFSGSGNAHLGSGTSARETDLNFTITAKKL